MRVGTVLTMAAVAVAALPAVAEAPSPRVAVSFDLDDAGWKSVFADYPGGEEEFHEIESGHRPLPRNVGGPRHGGFFVSGSNHSDDLWMSLAGRVEGLAPGQRYAARFRVTFASNAPRRTVGIGGAPGEAVTVKAGIVATEPLAVDGGGGFLVMNVDKGNQASGGEDALVLGHVGVPTSRERPRYRRKTLRTRGDGNTAVADGTGALWAIVGTDSGYEGTTSLYWTRVRIHLRPVLDLHASSERR